MFLPLVRHPFLSTTLLIAAFYFTTCAAETETIDNGDDRVHYNGPWTFQHSDDDPQGLNWQGTVSYGDIPGADCVVYFVGTRISVYGAFSPPGQYDMQSTYAIDDGPATTFTPNPVVSQSQYRQKFYESPTLSSGEHTLHITNLGRQFWFDFAQIEVDSPIPEQGPDPLPPPAPSVTTTTTVQDIRPTRTITKNDPQTPSMSSQGHSSSSTSTVPASSLSSSQTTPSSASPPTLSSFNSTSLGPPTPSDPSLSLPVPLDIQSPSSTDTGGVPGTLIPTPVGAASNPHANGLRVGAIVGIALAGAFVLALMLLLAWWLRRKHSAAAKRNIEPYDASLAPSPDSTGFPFDREKFALATSRNALIPPAALPYQPADTSTLQTPTSIAPLMSPVSHNTQTYGGGTRTRTTSSKLPTTAGGISPISPSAESSPGIFVSPPSVGTGISTGTVTAPRRQSLDGGVRLAGGPPGLPMQMIRPDRDSVFSTLPPSYQYYP